jgi:hypothetical protein
VEERSAASGISTMDGFREITAIFGRACRDRSGCFLRRVPTTPPRGEGRVGERSSRVAGKRPATPVREADPDEANWVRAVDLAELPT